MVEIRQEKIDLPELQTADLKEISADKAMSAFGIVKGPVLVDDSGIVFDGYPGFPGALTKFLYEWVWLAGIRKLFAGLDNKGAEFQCVLSYMDESQEQPIQFVWKVKGTVTFDRIDQSDEDPKLPYDLIFVADGMDKPVYYNMKRRNAEYNHRTRAAKMLSKWLLEK